MNGKKSYEDIMDVEYPFSTGRPRMSMHERAAQFSPFAALTGYEELIGEIVRSGDDDVKQIQDNQ